MTFLNWNLIILMALTLIVMPLVTAELLRVIGNYTKNKLVNSFGINSQIGFGGLGVITHELAHLITAKIFFHKITHFSLLEPRQYKYTGNLGYVEHCWNRNNIYEDLGNFFIGIAPCYVCSEVLWLIHGFLFSDQSLSYSNNYTVSSAIQTAFNNIAHPFGPVGWKLLLYVILVVMIASTGYGLSNEDMNGTWQGLIYWLLFTIIMYVFIILTGSTSLFANLFWKLVVLLLTFLGRGLIYLAFSFIIISVIDCF